MDQVSDLDTYTNVYETTLEGLKATLEEHGVAVLPNLLSVEDCLAIEDGLWSYLAHASQEWQTPIDKGDKTTWDLSNFSPLHSMLSQHHSIGHCQPAWDVRQNPTITRVFAKLWGTDELLTSFDGISICFPPEVTGKGWHRGNSLWLHSDMSYYYPQEKCKDKDCIQAWFTPRVVRSGDATLAFLHGSHKYHKRFGRKYDIQDKTDWYKLSPKQIETYTHKYKCELQRIKCSAGSLVLWDSRTVHCGQQPIKGRAEQNIRFCIYVCLMPRERATQAHIKNRVKAFEEMRLTTHHPITGKLFPSNPRIWSKEQKDKLEAVTPPEAPQLTLLGRRLVGYEDSESD